MGTTHWSSLPAGRLSGPAQRGGGSPGRHPDYARECPLPTGRSGPATYGAGVPRTGVSGDPARAAGRQHASRQARRVVWTGRGLGPRSRLVRGGPALRAGPTCAGTASRHLHRWSTSPAGGATTCPALHAGAGAAAGGRCSSLPGTAGGGVGRAVAGRDPDLAVVSNRRSRARVDAQHSHWESKRA